MIISLDRNALKELIDKDPDFELSLKSAVISEVGRRFFEKDSAKVIRAASPELFDQVVAAMRQHEDLHDLVKDALNKSLVERRIPYSATVSLTTEAAAHLKERVEALKSEALRNAANDVGRLYDELVRAAVDARASDARIEESVEKRVNRLTEEEINRRVDARVKAHFAEMQDALAAKLAGLVK